MKVAKAMKRTEATVRQKAKQSAASRVSCSSIARFMARPLCESGSIGAEIRPIAAAIVATMFATYVWLIYAGKLTEKLGATGIDALN